MKKLLISALVVTAAAFALTGCEDRNNPVPGSGSTNSSAVTSSDTVPSETASSDTISSDITSSSETVSSETASSTTSSTTVSSSIASSTTVSSGIASSTTVSSSTASSTIDSNETFSDPHDEYIPSLMEVLEFPDTRSGKTVKAALLYKTDEWSIAMMLADDETFSFLLPGISDMFEEYCMAFDIMGINGHTVFAGKPKSGQEDAVGAVFEESLEILKERMSFYPPGQESVANAQYGATNDGYIYFVIHQNGAAIADAMTK